ncbi:MAG: ECF transporter S component [Oscillospiraceae bacterium]|nr:ECF transporter S component [Oscillospiraceae bacterium]
MANRKTSTNTKRLTGIAIFSAIIILLQLFATFVKFGQFSITLTLIPIVVGSAVYGIGAGAFLGGVFGLIVLVACIFGWDIGGNILWTANPLITALLCFIKGIAAGFLSGVVYNLLAKKNSNLGIIAAAVISPVTNTGIFLAAMILFYNDILTEWAAGTPALSYIIFGLVGINFLIEFISNIVLSPVASRILKIKTKM